MSAATAVDPVTLTVIDNYCTSTCRDMGVTMMTTSYSPIFNESLDFSCVIFDPEGRMLAQAEFCPSQIGTIKFTVAWTIAELGAGAFDEGDVVLHNDPYRGSGHVPEHMLIKPVFWDGELVAFVANVAHMSEIGAKTPGGLSGDATEIFQEGLLLPPVKIKRRGEDVDDVWKIVLSNHRTPRVTYGDFRAMIGSLDMAEGRLHRLIADYGLDVFGAATASLMEIAERRMRAEIEQIPNGTYSFEDAIEDDGIGEGAYPMKLLLTIGDDEVIADFTGSAPQAVGPVNAIYAVTASAIYNGFLHLTD
ncbi:MAG: hydantoinase B/oxoprolinase family protein, partial [Gaiellales bacterium]